MPGNEEEKREWVRKVLGVEIGGSGQGQSTGEPPKVTAPGTPANDTLIKFSPVAIAKGALEWRQLCAQSRSEIDKLKNAIVTSYKSDGYDDDEVAEVVDRVSGLYDVLETLNESLADTIDEFLNANEAGKLAAQQNVLAEIDEFESLVTKDDLLADIDSNEFLNTGLQKRALAAMTALRQGFQATA